MSIPNEALQKLLVEIEQKAVFSQQQMGIVKSQMASKARETRMNTLTSTEVSSLPAGTPVYEGVGKMFVLTPTEEVKKRLETESEELKSETANLEKKLHYLETTYRTSRENIDQLFKRAGGGG
ncbi:Prefoldin [Aulographum hederae CBS 113979]|uniref:Prefoldin n=1 Tax=Aulographum hederae CBS 113979 TaxID=1176131 RepID=A0A6G1GVN2_9PEZI|nr:Prefoldin [Aulographum hederae CBS 113979]